MYVSGRVDIFDMVDIDLFNVIALNIMVLKLDYIGKFKPMFYNYLKPLTRLDEGLYALACEEDVRCMGTLIRSFKLIEIYIEHGVTTLDSYFRAPWFWVTLEVITDEAGSIAANRNEKMLLLTWHEFSETTKEPVCESVIDDVIMQLLFDKTKLDGEAGFVDVAGSGVDSSRLSHDESFGVDDLDLNLNEHVNLNVSQFKTQSELHVSEEPDVGPTQEPILAEVSTQEPIVVEEFSVEDVLIKDYVSSKEDAEQGNGQEDKYAPTDGQFLYDDEGIDIGYEIEYDVQSSEDASTDDDGDVNEDFLVNEENEIVEPNVDVRLFGISMDLPFGNIGITNLVSDDVLEGEDIDVINADGFDSDPGNNEERNYRKRRLAKLRTKMEGFINASGQWKYLFYTGQKFTSPKEAKDRVYLHSIKSRRNLKLYKNDSVRIRARCEGKVHVFTMVNPDILVKAVQDQLQRELEVQISMSKAFRAKAKAKREIRGDHCLGDVIDLHPNSNFTFISDRQKDGVDKHLLWRAASATNVRDFEKFMLELKMMNPKTHEWLNKIPTEHYARSYFLGRGKSNLFLNNIYEVFNGKIIRGRNKPVITLLEYIKEYCMKRIVNVQGMVDKANKYQVSSSLGDQCVMDVVSMTCSCRKYELTRIPYKHVVAACWNMALNDRAAPPLETWVNPCYWLSTWKETYSHKIQPICGTKYWEKSTCPTTLLPPKHHVQVAIMQTEPAIGQDGSSRSGVGVVIGLPIATVKVVQVFQVVQVLPVKVHPILDGQ
ncbi:putative transposase, mutator type, MULE transposase domain protein [Tanacetum coccineum]